MGAMRARRKGETTPRRTTIGKNGDAKWSLMEVFLPAVGLPMVALGVRNILIREVGTRPYYLGFMLAYWGTFTSMPLMNSESLIDKNRMITVIVYGLGILAQGVRLVNRFGNLLAPVCAETQYLCWWNLTHWCSTSGVTILTLVDYWYRTSGRSRRDAYATFQMLTGQMLVAFSVLIIADLSVGVGWHRSRSDTPLPDKFFWSACLAAETLLLGLCMRFGGAVNRCGVDPARAAATLASEWPEVPRPSTARADSLKMLDNLALPVLGLSRRVHPSLGPKSARFEVALWNRGLRRLAGCDFGDAAPLEVLPWFDWSDHGALLRRLQADWDAFSESSPVFLLRFRSADGRPIALRMEVNEPEGDVLLLFGVEVDPGLASLARPMSASNR